MSETQWRVLKHWGAYSKGQVITTSEIPGGQDPNYLMQRGLIEPWGENITEPRGDGDAQGWKAKAGQLEKVIEALKANRTSTAIFDENISLKADLDKAESDLESANLQIAALSESVVPKWQYDQLQAEMEALKQRVTAKSAQAVANKIAPVTETAPAATEDVAPAATTKS